MLVLHVALAVAWLTGPAAADTVSDAAAEGFTDLWDVTAEIDYSDQRGAHSLQVFSGGIRLSHLRRERFRLDAAVRSRYGRSDGEVATRNHRGEVSFDLSPEDRVTPFLFTEAERDALRRVRLRMSSGAGAKYTPVHSAGGEEVLSVSLALLHSYERVAREPEPEPEPDAPLPDPEIVGSVRARWSLRVRGEHALGSGARLHYRSFYQPLWGELADYLLRSEAGLRVDLTERLGLSMRYQWDRERSEDAPPAPDERHFRTGIVLSL